MPDIAFPIANGAYLSNSLPISAQECTNWYPNIVQTAALNGETLFGTPGSAQIATTGPLEQINRGSHTLDSIPYFVNGDRLHRVDRAVVDEVETFSTVDLGIVEGAERVSMADNGTQLMILQPGGKGYIFTKNPDTLTEITDTDFTANGNPQLVVFIDGFFVVTTDSKKFIVSAINDGLNWNALDFGTAEADPDDIVAPVVLNNQLFIGGATTFEAFQNIGGADFPFQRTGLFIPKGVSAAFSAIPVNNTFMFVGGGRDESSAVWELQGNSAQKISTTAIDSILQDLTDTQISDIFAWSYAQKGAYFIGFSLPETTVVYDTITGRWHERKSQIVDSKNVTRVVRSRVNSLVSAYGKVLVGDSIDGRIGSLDPNVFKEYDRNIIRTVATQPLQKDMRSFSIPRIELTMESGVGTTETPDPKIRMERSKDGGITYGPSRTRPIGKKGETTRRIIWRRNGRAARFEIFRFTLSDAVKPVIIQLTLRVPD